MSRSLSSGRLEDQAHSSFIMPEREAHCSAKPVGHYCFGDDTLGPKVQEEIDTNISHW